MHWQIRTHAHWCTLTWTVRIINNSLVPDLKHRKSGGTTRVTSEIHDTSWNCTISVISFFLFPGSGKSSPHTLLLTALCPQWGAHNTLGCFMESLSPIYIEVSCHHTWVASVPGLTWLCCDVMYLDEEEWSEGVSHFSWMPIVCVKTQS